MPSYSACDLLLITISDSNCRLFSDINILLGSVATHLRSGGIVGNNFTANLSLSLTVKEFSKSVKICQSYAMSLVAYIFGTRVSY